MQDSYVINEVIIKLWLETYVLNIVKMIKIEYLYRNIGYACFTGCKWILKQMCLSYCPLQWYILT